MSTSFTLWAASAVLIWSLGAVVASRRSMLSGIWFLVGSLGLGLCSLFLGMVGQPAPPISDAIWLRSLWTTLLLCVPVWVGFSYRFGRGNTARAPLMRPVLLLLWGSAVVLLYVGLKHAPLVLMEERKKIVLLAPAGRPIAFHVVCGLVLILWNLQATLEAARATSRRRVELAVYSLIPLTVTAIYLFSEILLYGQQRYATTRLMLPALLISTVGFAGVVGWRQFNDIAIPGGRKVIYSSVVLTALGILFVALAAIAQVLRALRVPWGKGWYEQALAATLIVVFALTIFPGLRAGIRRFADENLFASRFDYRQIWERMNRMLASDLARNDLPKALQLLFLDTFGPVRVHFWIRAADSGAMLPLIVGSDLPKLPVGHPLREALANRREPLAVSGDASSVGEVALHLVCEDLAQKKAIRAYIPIRAEDDLIGIIGCGSGEKRTLHPEDLTLMQMMSDHLAGIFSQQSAARARTTATSLEGVDPREGRRGS
jgi:hypothetical protein